MVSSSVIQGSRASTSAIELRGSDPESVSVTSSTFAKPADALMELYGNEITSSGPGTEHVIFARGTIVATGTKLFSDDMLSYGPGSNVDYPSEEGFVKASALSRWKCWCHHSAGVPETVTIWRCGVTLYSVSEDVASVHVAAKPRSLGCQITR